MEFVLPLETAQQCVDRVESSSFPSAQLQTAATSSRMVWSTPCNKCGECEILPGCGSVHIAYTDLVACNLMRQTSVNVI